MTKLRVFFTFAFYKKMKFMKLKRSEEMLLALLCAALHQREVEIGYFQQVTADDWVQCYRLAVRQGVSALAWEGIERLPVTYTPPLDVKVSWALLEKKQLATYRKHCQAVNELTQFFAQHGIATVVLKGVGLSRLYPVPAHRESGDIDIYTYSVDKKRMTDEEANRLANELMERQGLHIERFNRELHNSFNYRGITFENHWRFFNIDIYTELSQVETWLKKCLSPQSVSLLDDNCQISVPLIIFDRVFVSLHAAKHYGNGLLLRHLCDWVVLNQQEGLKYPEELDNKYFLQTTTVLSQLTNRYLGSSISVGGNDKLANAMMKEIMRPPSYVMFSSDNAIRAGWCKIRLKLHLLGLRKRLLGVPVWRSVMFYIISILSKPSRLYR